MSDKNRIRIVEYLHQLNRRTPGNYRLPLVEHEKVKSLLVWMKNNPDNIIETWIKENYSKETKLPAWLLGLSKLNGLNFDTLELPEYLDKSFFASLRDGFFSTCEFFIKAVDIIKQGPNAVEDVLTVLMRIPNFLNAIPEVTFRLCMGILNLLTPCFELIKSLYYLGKRYISPDEEEEDITFINNVSYASAIVYTITAIVFIALYLKGIIVLPGALLLGSAAMLGFASIMAMRSYELHKIMKARYEESSSPESEFSKELNKLEQECETLLEECKKLEKRMYTIPPEANQTFNETLEEINVLPQKKIELNEKIHKLGMMRERVKYDRENYLDAERELSFAVIDVIAYSLAFIAAAISIALFFNPFTLPFAASAAFGVTIAGIAIGTCVKLFQIIDEYAFNYKMTNWIRKTAIDCYEAVRDYLFPKKKFELQVIAKNKNTTELFKALEVTATTTATTTTTPTPIVQSTPTPTPTPKLTVAETPKEIVADRDCLGFYTACFGS